MCLVFILHERGIQGYDSEQVWYCVVFYHFITLAHVRPHTTVFFKGLLVLTVF
jgi:hypothetical protein